MAHNEEYYRFYRHRVYEVESQKFYKYVRTKRKETYIAGQMRFAAYAAREFPSLWNRTASGEEFRKELERLINTTVTELHRKISLLNSKKWWTDLRIMELDIRFSYRLIYAVLWILGESQNREE